MGSNVRVYIGALLCLVVFSLPTMGQSAAGDLGIQDIHQLTKSNGVFQKKDSARGKRSCDNHVFTMGRFVELVQKLENHPKVWDKSLRSISAYLRNYVPGDFEQHRFCYHETKKIPNGVFTESEMQLLQDMIHYRQISEHNWLHEMGVVLTDREDTVALGQVLTGIACGGLDRGRGVTFVSWVGLSPFELDNLYLATISADLAKTNYAYNSQGNIHLLGPAGRWDKLACPKQYTLDGNPSSHTSEATDSVILATIDGLLMGMILRDIESQNLKLSEMLLSYYGGQGLGSRKLFHDQNRIENFKMSISDYFVTEQTVGFSKELTKDDNLDRTLMRHIPDTILDFYGQELMAECPESVTQKYTITYFSEIVEELETTTGYNLVNMVDALLGLYIEHFRAVYYDNIWSSVGMHSARDGYYWEIAAEMVHHRIVSNSRRELGILQQTNRQTLAIAHVLFGIKAGFNRQYLEYQSDMLYRSTVVGSLARSMLDARVLNSDKVIGDRGNWEYSCHARHLLNTNLNQERASMAEIIGSIDGFVLGDKLTSILNSQPNLKLSTVLRQYYGTGINGDATLTGVNRIDNFKQISEGKPKLVEETILACGEFLNGDERIRFRRIGQNECTSMAVKSVDALYEKILEVEHSPVDWLCFGDFTQLNPNGASNQTKFKYNLTIEGVDASYQLLDEDVEYLNSRRHCYEDVARRNCLHPALIAAMVSRESRAGQAIEATNGYGPSPAEKEYGLLQCTRKHDLEDCHKYPWDSCEHIDMMVDDVFMVRMRGVQKLQRDWSPAEKLQGAVAAFNFGVKHVWDFEKLDKGSTRNDYSGDVIARAQRLVTEHGWRYNYHTETMQKRAVGYENSGSVCGNLADEGDCAFYSCVEVESQKSCGSDGYALGTGYKICEGLFHNMANFNDKGKTSICTVGKCLMKELLTQYHSPASNCRNLHEIAYTAQGDCYQENWETFCPAVKDMQNWDALFDVYTTAGIPNEIQASALSQLRDAVGFCATKLSGLETTMTNVDVDAKLKEVFAWSNTDEEDHDASCVSHANSGDCKFYECFEKRFPCSGFFPTGHINDFELPNCRVLRTNEDKFDSPGKTWMKNSQKCLMQSLVPYYESSTVNCASLHSFLVEKRLDCYIDNGYCTMIDKNELAIQQSFAYTGYPLSTPQEMGVKSYYYRELFQIGKRFGDINYECQKRDLRSSSEIYRTIYSLATGLTMRIKRPRRE